MISAGNGMSTFGMNRVPEIVSVPERNDTSVLHMRFITDPRYKGR
jgi:hypothetical protein